MGESRPDHVLTAAENTRYFRPWPLWAATRALPGVNRKVMSATPRRKLATYEDPFASPEHLVGEIVDGDLFASQAFLSTCLAASV